VVGTFAQVRGRVVLGALLALGAAVPVVLTASPASAAGCTASVSDPTPQQNETVTISFVGPASTSATVAAHFQSTDLNQTVTTDANGHGSAGLDIGGAAYGETVVVDIVAGTASCSVSFTPTAAASTTTTTATASPTSTTTSTTSTTSTTTALTVASTPVTTAGTAVAAAQAAATLPFTGVGGGAVVVGLIGLVLLAAGHATRRILARRC